MVGLDDAVPDELRNDGRKGAALDVEIVRELLARVGDFERRRLRGPGRGAEKREDLVGDRLLRQAFKLRCELDAPFGDDDELLVAWRQRGDSVGWPLHDWNPNILQGASQV